jgi:hypothetical protein
MKKAISLFPVVIALVALPLSLRSSEFITGNAVMSGAFIDQVALYESISEVTPDGIMLAQSQDDQLKKMLDYADRVSDDPTLLDREAPPGMKPSPSQKAMTVRDNKQSISPVIIAAIITAIATIVGALITVLYRSRRYR